MAQVVGRDAELGAGEAFLDAVATARGSLILKTLDVLTARTATPGAGGPTR